MPTEISGSTGVNKIQDNTIVNADINSSAAIAGSKISGGTGKVLQVLSNTISAGATTTSSTMAALGLSQAITPSSTSSKIYVTVTGGNTRTQDDVGNIFTIYRDSTDLKTGTDGMVIVYSSGSGVTNFAFSWAMQKLDSPNTTSATTYSVYWRTRDNGNTTQNHWLGGETTMTLMEIAG